MNAEQARQLLPGTVVMWDGDPENRGTVRKVEPDAVYIDWEDGQAGWDSLTIKECKAISLYTPEA